MSSVRESEKSEVKVCLCIVAHCGRRTKGFQWHGRTSVSDHLPVRQHSVNLSEMKREYCGAKTGMRASEQCVKKAENMCAIRCLSAPRHSDRGGTRSNRAFGLPKLRRCFWYVSVSVRVIRSEVFGKFLPFPSFLMTSLN